MLVSDKDRTERIKELVENIPNMNELVDSIIMRLIKSNDQFGIDRINFFIGYNVYYDKLDVLSSIDTEIGSLYASLPLSKIYLPKDNKLESLRSSIEDNIRESVSIEAVLISINKANNRIIKDDCSNNIFDYIKFGSISTADLHITDIISSRPEEDKSILLYGSDIINITLYEKLYSDRVSIIKLKRINIDLDSELILSMLTGNRKSEVINSIVNMSPIININEDYKEIVELSETNAQNNILMYTEILKNISEDSYKYTTRKDSIERLKTLLEFISLIEFT